MSNTEFAKKKHQQKPLNPTYNALIYAYPTNLFERLALLHESKVEKQSFYLNLEES